MFLENCYEYREKDVWKITLMLAMQSSFNSSMLQSLCDTNCDMPIILGTISISNDISSDS